GYQMMVPAGIKDELVYDGLWNNAKYWSKFGEMLDLGLPLEDSHQMAKEYIKELNNPRRHRNPPEELEQQPQRQEEEVSSSLTAAEVGECPVCGKGGIPMPDLQRHVNHMKAALTVLCTSVSSPYSSIMIPFIIIVIITLVLIDAWMEDPAAKDNDTYHITLPPTDLNSGHRTATTPSSYHSYDDITEDAINDKREFIKSACISYGVLRYDIGMLLSMSNTLWTGMGIKGRLAIAKRSALRYMQHKASSLDRAELWSAMATRQRPIDKMRSINIPVEMDCRLSI
ncbi:hypothetical protein FOZ63_034152, partial [Perkinsus olseni]